MSNYKDRLFEVFSNKIKKLNEEQNISDSILKKYPVALYYPNSKTLRGWDVSTHNKDTPPEIERLYRSILLETLQQIENEKEVLDTASNSFYIGNH